MTENEKHTLEDVYQQIRYVEKEVHNLSLTKQDRIKPAVVVSLLLFLLVQTGGGAWWASRMETSLTSGLTNLTEKVIELGKDRFYGRDAEHQQRLWEIEFGTLKAEMIDMKSQLRDTRKTMNETTAKISSIKSVQVECAKRLDIKEGDYR